MNAPLPYIIYKSSLNLLVYASFIVITLNSISRMEINMIHDYNIIIWRNNKVTKFLSSLVPIHQNAISPAV